MKNLLLIIVFYCSSISFAQKESMYLLLDENISIEQNKNTVGAYYDCVLSVKTGKDTDYYNFVINGDETKSFEENSSSGSLVNVKIYNTAALKLLTPCELHARLSDFTIYFVKKAEVAGEFKIWSPQYLNTARNRIIMKQKNKI